MRTWWIVAALLSCSAFACAQDKPFVFIHGFDKMSCEDWFGSDGNPDIRQQYIAWVRGVVTGYNYANPGSQVTPGRMPTDFGLSIFVDNYCHSTHAASVATAAFALISDRHGGPAVQMLDDQPKPVTKPDARNVAKSKSEDLSGGAPSGGDSPGFRDWLSRQSADIKSLDVEVQKSIYKKESALQGSLQGQ